MRHITFSIGELGTFSTNSMNDYFISGGKVGVKNSNKYNELLTKMAISIKQNKESVSSFIEYYKQLEKRCLVCRIVFNIPEKIIFKKDGDFKDGVLDIDNLAKPVIDAVFRNLPRRPEKTSKGIKLVSEINDSRIMRLHLFKNAVKSDSISVEITLQAVTLDEIAGA